MPKAPRAPAVPIEAFSRGLIAVVIVEPGVGFGSLVGSSCSDGDCGRFSDRVCAGIVVDLGEMDVLLKARKVLVGGSRVVLGT